jgi:aryl-alcohol dehydrogenase-like predicted oxidoreductase
MAMKYVRLGSSGVSVSRICLGCGTYGDKKWWPWIMDEAEARPHFAKAIEAGINFFDTANRYSAGASESITGRWLSEMGKRDELVIATKVYGRIAEGPNMAGLSRKHIIQNCEASLKRLRTDYIDLYYMHRWDFTTPIEETISAFDYLIGAGKVRYLGASSMAAWQFSEALHLTRQTRWHRFASMQNLYNLLYREEEREMIALCVDEGVGVIPWSPRAGGVLARAGSRPGEAASVRAATQHPNSPGRADHAVIEAVGKVAAARGVPPAQVALSWVINAPGVASPIVGSTRLGHLEDAIKAVDLVLTPQERSALEAPYQTHSIAGHIQPSAARMLKSR